MLYVTSYCLWKLKTYTLSLLLFDLFIIRPKTCYPNCYCFIIDLDIVRAHLATLITFSNILSIPGLFYFFQILKVPCEN